METVRVEALSRRALAFYYGRCRSHVGWLQDGVLLLPTDVPGGFAAELIGMEMSGDITCALEQTGGIECWGYNRDGALGDGTTLPRWTPGPVKGLPAPAVALAAGAYFQCALLQSKQVMCWGRNDQGQLGDGTNTSRSTPKAVVGLPTDIAAISCGWHCCVIRTSGEVMCWGENTHGQLGDGTHRSSSVPVRVLGLP